MCILKNVELVAVTLPSFTFKQDPVGCECVRMFMSVSVKCLCLCMPYAVDEFATMPISEELSIYVSHKRLSSCLCIVIIL